MGHVFLLSPSPRFTDKIRFYYHRVGTYSRYSYSLLRLVRGAHSRARFLATVVLQCERADTEPEQGAGVQRRDALPLVLVLPPAQRAPEDRQEGTMCHDMYNQGMFSFTLSPLQFINKMFSIMVSILLRRVGTYSQPSLLPDLTPPQRT